MSDIVVDENTNRQQAIASNPKNSAWVSANAGSGKTHVLSQRIVRLLLSGADPSRIVALTFTKAAAGEMSVRVFEILGRWATMSKENLESALMEMEGQRPSASHLERARTLFARALETPGGLKIQTIHAFCEALLHQFPLEANIPGNFSIMDDAAQTAALSNAQTAVVLQADQRPGSKIGQAFAAIMKHAGDAQIEKAFVEIIANRDELFSWLESGESVQELEEKARKRFQFSADITPDELAASALQHPNVDDNFLKQISVFAHSTGMKKGQNVKLANRIDAYFSQAGIQQKLEKYEAIFTTDKGARAYSQFSDAALKEEFPALKRHLENESERLTEARQHLNTLRVIVATSPMMEIVQAIISHYRRAKREQGLLDYDDLVARTADLLTRSDARRWVLYKLDLGIDHILVDEAQDTSPRQWQVISSLVTEFFAGESMRTTRRTVFAVGDEKQSIYSFQGARPESFAAHRKLFDKMARDVEQDLKKVSLGLSFRSSQDVLSAVDTVFALPENADGLSFGGDLQAHTAARRSALGKVDIWPLEAPEKPPEPESVDLPQPQMHNGHQAIKLANKIAAQIKTWIRDDKIDPGKILVLVRARDRFMVAINRALKDLNLPVAGADRLSLTDHIAVKDLLALGQIMLTPDDDLTLASLLKSPLFNVSEEDLYRLARNRLKEKYEISLYESLEELQDDATFSEALAHLNVLRGRVDQMPTYEFYARLLGADGGRKRFYARLGNEAEDVIDAFLDLTLTHETGGLPGLQSFIESLQMEAPEIKREMDQSAGQVRVMTVHAAKGLEAPIVFLVDKCSAAFQPNHTNAFYRWGDDVENGFLWVPKAAMHSLATADAKAEEKRLAEQEYRRLLYVAMTRARDHLIVCGYKGSRSLASPNWHAMVSGALESTAEQIVEGEHCFLRWRHEDQRPKDISTASPAAQHELRATQPIEMPQWLKKPLPAENRLPRPLSPSGAQAIIEESLTLETQIVSLLESDTKKQEESPRLRGTAIHALLQLLPDVEEDQRWQKGKDYLDRALPMFSTPARSAMLDGIRRVFDDPKLRFYFDPKTSRAEVPIMGQIELASGMRPISGTIDRLALLDDHLMLLDYKTSTYVPNTIDDISDTYITQMALYRALVSKLYPTKDVRAALVWTHAPDQPRFFEIPVIKLHVAMQEIEKL